MTDGRKEGRIDSVQTIISWYKNNGILIIFPIQLLICLRCVFNMDDNKTIDNVTINSLTEKDLAMNVYSNGEWGSYRHSALKPGNICYL